jgi:mannose-6-phosphate isomerase
MQPLVFTPWLRPAIWGSRRLATHLSKPLSEIGDAWGESWEISVHPAHQSRVAEGPHTGTLLEHLCRDHPKELFGESWKTATSFPWLIKYLDANDWLSVQVHPDDERAPLLANEPLGKTEAWVVLAVTPGAKIYAGLKAGVDRKQFASVLGSSAVRECLHEVEPKVGDCFFYKAGTVHAVGGGVLLAEVQQSSDATLRIYDWDRVGSDGKPRTLHVGAALEAIDYKLGPVEPIRTESELLVSCKYFRLMRKRITGSATWPAAKQMSVVMVLDGDVELMGGEKYFRGFKKGETVLLPGSCGDLQWSSRKGATLLQALPQKEQEQ